MKWLPEKMVKKRNEKAIVRIYVFIAAENALKAEIRNETANGALAIASHASNCR